MREPGEGFKRVASDPRRGEVCVDSELEEQTVVGLDFLGRESAVEEGLDRRVRKRRVGARAVVPTRGVHLVQVHWTMCPSRFAHGLGQLDRFVGGVARHGWTSRTSPSELESNVSTYP